MTTKANMGPASAIADNGRSEIKPFRVISGAIVGAAAGALLSTFLIPIPLFGTAFGAILGAILNGWLASRTPYQTTNQLR